MRKQGCVNQCNDLCEFTAGVDFCPGHGSCSPLQLPVQYLDIRVLQRAFVFWPTASAWKGPTLANCWKEAQAARICWIASGSSKTAI